MTVPERLSALRKCMEEKNIDVYVVPTADFHQSEYVGEHFKSEKVHYRVLRISRNRCDHKDRSKTLDRRTLLHPGSSTVGGDNCRTHEKWVSLVCRR